MTCIRLLAGLSALCNLTVVIAVAATVFLRFQTAEQNGSRRSDGVRIFRYFTTDSNLLAALACLAILPFSLRVLFTGGGEIPAFAYLFKYIAVCSVSLTLLTVICFLAPAQGFGKMYGGANLWLHLICPLLCICSYLFLEPHTKPDWRVTFTALIPVILYAAVYLVAVVFIGEERGGWKDFYGFNRGGKWYVSLPLMLGVAYLISLGQWALPNLLLRGGMT